MSELELLKAMDGNTGGGWLDGFKLRALAAHREVSAAVDFAEQAADAEEMGAASVVDLEFATSAVNKLTEIADELREVLDARAAAAAGKEEA